jgi:DNA-binding GntR family transcriptional regulator
LPNGVYEQLRDDVVTGRFDSGEPLVETALAALYGVSRTPVREALRRLEQDGLVERGSRGMQVRSRSPEEILEIYEVRIILEAAAARAAAERRTTLDLMRLEQLHEAMLGTASDDAAAIAEHNRRFHEELWHASHNSTLIDLLTRLGAHLVRFRETTLTYDGRWQTVLEDHSALLAAVRDGDGDRAADISTTHMMGARDTRLKMYAAAKTS